jgi:hypothetical protein
MAIETRTLGRTAVAEHGPLPADLYEQAKRRLSPGV